MKLNHTLLFVAVMLTVFSCKKSGEPVKEEQKPTPTKLLVKITEVAANQTTQFTNLTYDMENRLINQKSPRQEAKYSYNQNRLFQIETGTSVHEFIYESGLLKKINHKSSTTNPIVFDLVFTYQGSKVTHTERVEGKTVIFKEDLQYAGENIATSIRTDDRYVYKYEFTYDDKKNINAGLGTQMIFGMSLTNNQIPTMNNLTSEKYTLLQNDKVVFTITTSYEYTYDSEGFPLTCAKKIQHSAQSTPTETRFTYEYKVF